MSGSSKRRHSKWDHKDSEALQENFYDRAQTRRPREPLSPGRGSRRHDSRSKESTVAWDREGNYTRISPELDEWRPRHSSRSPRNVWGRSHRISKSRSRSRSQSPAHNFRRELTVKDRSRSRSGASAQICRDFAAGRCRRGNSCHFLHQDEIFDSRRLECSSPDDWESRRRRTGGSRYSPDDKDSAIRTNRSAHTCNDFLKGRCRRGDSCRFVHDDTAADVFEKGPIEEYRNRDHDLRSRDIYPDHDYRSRDTYRDHDHRRRDTYPDRIHECEPPKRSETPCKFFAAGNCRNGTRCKFSHQVQEIFSPDRRSRGDRRGPEHKFEGSQVWDGPKWSDATTVSTVPTVQGWGEDKNEKKEMNTERTQGDGRGPDHKYEDGRVWDVPSWSDVTTLPDVAVVHERGDDKNEIKEVAKDVSRARPDDCCSRDMLDINKKWDTSANIGKSETQGEKQLLQWKIETNHPGMGLSVPRNVENSSGDMEISPRDIKEQGLNSSTPQTPSISNIPFPVVQQGIAGEASYEKHYQGGFQEQKVFHDSFAEQNPNYKVNKPVLYSGERRDVVGDHDGSCVIQNQSINVSQGQDIFQPDPNVKIHPISNIIPSPGQSQLSLPSHPPPGQNHLSLPSHPPPGQNHPSLPSLPSRGKTMQVSHNSSSFFDKKVADGSHVVSLASSALAPESATAHSTVSNVQLAQLSHLTASLTQLLESRQQLSQFSSTVTPHGKSNLTALAAPVPPASGSMIHPNQAPEVLKSNDPVFNSIEPKMPNLGNHLLPSIELKNSNNELHHRANNETHLEGGNVNEQEPLTSSKDEENGMTTAEGRIQVLENGPSDVGADDGADDIKKLKDTKGIRPFKFALAEFVKELLKPSWKDGHVSKEAYKTIVKKVVDKVLETLGPQIPQTKEKIDLYLSCSKQKIDKLVQAYVGKHQKS